MWSVAFSNKRGLMAQVIAESSRVFHKTGPIDEKTVAKFLVRYEIYFKYFTHKKTDMIISL